MSTTITTTQPQEGKGIRIGSVADAMAFGRMAANSLFVPKDLRGKPEDIALAAIHGAELGLGPMQAIQSIAVINGRPSVWGDVALALVRGSGLCETVYEGIEGDGDKRVGFCEVCRKGERPQRREFSVTQAKQAGLWGKAGPWQAYADRMLQLRARGFALRDVFPDVLRGLVTAEEAGDYQHAEPVKEPVVYRPKMEARKVAEAVVEPVVETVEPVVEAVAAMVEQAAAPSSYDRAMGAVARASTIDRCDTIRRNADKALAEERLTKFEYDEVVAALVAKAESLIAEEATT